MPSYSTGENSKCCHGFLYPLVQSEVCLFAVEFSQLRQHGHEPLRRLSAGSTTFMRVRQALLYRFHVQLAGLFWRELLDGVPQQFRIIGEVLQLTEGLAQSEYRNAVVSREFPSSRILKSDAAKFFTCFPALSVTETSTR